MWVIDRGKKLGEVEAWDRGAQFGDGLFETILILNGEPQNFLHHLNRLEKSLTKLAFKNFPENFGSLIIERLNELIIESKTQSGILKIMVSRGDSSRGYAVAKDLKPNITFLYSAITELPGDLYSNGIKVKVCRTQCSINEQLAGLKHLNRLENVMAKQELVDEYEGLMQNGFGHIIEGTMSNVFFEKDNVLYTPDLQFSGVEGVLRARVLEECAKHDIDVMIENISVENITHFESAFICNSVIGIVPISDLDNNKKKISPLTRQLQTLLNKRGI